MNCMASNVIKLLKVSLVLILISSNTNAFENKKTHPAINREAFKSVNELNNYFTKELDFSDGINQIFNGIAISKWLEKGGDEEDAHLDSTSTLRYRRHYHDPMFDCNWDSAGLLGVAFSALEWAQSSSNAYSWNAARDSYYRALSTNDEESYANTFFYLGTIMHLVSDMAVPAHSRDDFHPGQFGGIVPFESWVKDRLEQRLENNSLLREGILNKPPYEVDSAIFNEATCADTAVGVPISALFDQDKYNGANRDITWSEDVGLAEFSNANFLTQDTIGDYPVPSAIKTGPEFGDSVKYEMVEAEDGTTGRRAYIWNENPSYRLIAVGYFTNDLLDLGLPDIGFQTDDLVHEDYANLLIPRAVGYSAALLKYFFRGELDLLPDQDIGSGFVIKNETDEDMQGIFRLFYDNSNGERIQVENGGLPYLGPINANGTSANIDFEKPYDIKEPGKYMLVFEGKLGKEPYAVIGNIVHLPRKPYLVIKADGAYESGARFIVFDPRENEIAQIKNESGEIITMPCSATEISYWLNKTKSNGTSLAVSDNVNPENNLHYDKMLWCETYGYMQEPSFVLSVDGEVFMNSCGADIVGPHGYSDTLEKIFHANPGSNIFFLYTGKKSCNTVELRYTRENTGIICGDGYQELRYFNSEYRFISPIGEDSLTLVNYDWVDCNDSGLNKFPVGEMLNSSLNYPTANVSYFEDIVVQIYAYTDTLFMDTPIEGQHTKQQFIKVFATCDTNIENPKNIDPTSLPRNITLEEEIESLFHDYHEYNLSLGKPDHLYPTFISSELKN